MSAWVKTTRTLDDDFDGEVIYEDDNLAVDNDDVENAPLAVTQSLDISEPGDMASEQMERHGSTWMVSFFHLLYSGWETDPTTSEVGSRENVSAANAVEKSRKSQFPNSAFSQYTAAQFLAELDRKRGSESTTHSEDEIADALSYLTYGKFRLIVVTGDTANPLAVRAGVGRDRKGDNFYVRLTKDGEQNVWESLRNKDSGPMTNPRRSQTMHLEMRTQTGNQTMAKAMRWR
jgi:hypothetical protein